MNNEEIIQKAGKGDSSVFEKIYQDNHGKLFSVAFRYLHNKEDAEDVVQETFINAFKFFYKFDGRAEISTWLTRICLNLCWHRKERKAESGKWEVPLDKEIETEDNEVKIQIADDRPQPPEEIEKKQAAEKIRIAIDSMKKKYREIIVLRELEGYSYEEITKILKISQGTVMSRLHRARKILLKKLQLSI
ncbi:MAG: RNA polymerase sigma factor [Elusimicrobiota bacterium]